MAARCVRDAEVGGSNPPFPTKERVGQGVLAGSAAIPRQRTSSSLPQPALSSRAASVTSGRRRAMDERPLEILGTPEKVNDPAICCRATYSYRLVACRFVSAAVARIHVDASGTASRTARSVDALLFPLPRDAPSFGAAHRAMRAQLEPSRSQPRLVAASPRRVVSSRGSEGADD